MIVQRELKTTADLYIIAELGRGPGRVHFQAYLDQKREQIVFFSADGKRLATLAVAEGRSPALPGLFLTNRRGDVRLDRLRIARWNGKIPSEVRASEPRIHRVDGSIVYGQVIRFDAGSKAFLLKTETGELRVPADQVSTAFFPDPEDAMPRLIRVVFQDGSRISGDLVKAGDGILELKTPGFSEPVRLPLASLRALEVLRKAE